MFLTLSEILSSLLSEFQSANIAADVNREHWREIYRNSALLNEFSPSRIRLSTASISIPLAIEKIEDVKVHDYGITPQQINSILPERLRGEDKSNGEVIYARLEANKKHYFLNSGLASDIVDVLTTCFRNQLSEIELADARQKVQKIQQEFISKPHSSRETKFIYRTCELEKIPEGRLLKFDIQIIID